MVTTLIDHALEALKAIRTAGRLTRQDIARQLNISLSLATKIASELIARGWVTGTGKVGVSASGRPADWLALVPGAAYAVGLDIGDHQQVAVVTNLVGDVVADVVEPALVTDDRAAIIANLQALVDRVLAAAGLSRPQVAGIGVGLADMVDPVERVSYGWPDTPGWSSAWTDFAVGQALDQAFDVPHRLVDDIVRTLGLAEARYGQPEAAQQDFAFVLVDSGVGMALMLDGTPYIGHSRIAGEIAHLQIDPQGQMCSCGNRGCLQTLTGTSALLALVAERLAESPIRSTLRGAPEPVTAEAVIAAAQQGDKLAQQTLNDVGEPLGRALAMVVNLVGPARLVLGGALANSPEFVDATRRAMFANSLSVAGRRVELHTSQLGRNAGARGAATQVLDALFADRHPNLTDFESHAVRAQP